MKSYKKLSPREKRKVRIRKKITGTPERPRLAIFRSNKYVYAQLIDDTNQKTLVSANTLKTSKACNKAAAKEVGSLIAEKAKSLKLENVVFDRGGYIYHGVVKELADAAREAGLKF